MTAQYSNKFIQALQFAADEHCCQLRKGTTIPYISHLMSVSALVMENGGDEEQAIAGLLHDVIEDAEPPSKIPLLRQTILETFGSRVLKLVEGCTDGVADVNGIKPEWRERKETYLAHLVEEPNELLLVSCCDKLHNARAILDDFKTIGEAIFDRFSGKKDGTLWYYQSLVAIYEKRIPHLKAVKALRQTVDSLVELSQ